MNFAFFQGLFANLITPIMAQIMAMLAGMTATMQPIALVMAAAALGIMGMDVAAGTRSWNQLFKDFFIAGLLVGTLQLAIYQQYVSNFFLVGLPNTISAALGGNGVPAAGLDNVLNNAVTATVKVYQALPSYSLKTIPLALAMLCFLVLDAVCVAFSFFVYTLAAISNVLVVVVGPVFLAAGVAPWSRFLLSGWFRLLVSGTITQLFAVAVLTLLSAAEIAQLNTVANGVIGGDNAIGQIWALCQSAILIGLCTAIVMKAPSLAREIAGGVNHTATAAAASFGAAGAVTNIATTAASGGAAAVGARAATQVGAGAVRAMASRPVGASLSKAGP